MQLNQVRYFIEAARLLNFTKAADICCVTQPALTKGIKTLEDELGGPLFHRAPKLCLTDLGRRVLPFIEQTYVAANSVRQLAQSFRSGEVVPISIGLDSGVPTAIIKPMLAELCRVFSGLSLNLFAGTADMLLQELLGGDLDIVVRSHDGAADRQPLHHVPLVSEKLVVVCAPDHPFAQEGPLELDALLRSEDRISFCATADRLLDSLGMAEPARHHAGSVDQLSNLVSLGAGWCLMPESYEIATDHASHDVPEPGLSRLIEIIYPAGRPHGTAVSAFLRMARTGARPEAVRAIATPQ
jgi:DNA-binding transcriptional LysR family regulator